MSEIGGYSPKHLLHLASKSPKKIDYEVSAMENNFWALDKLLSDEAECVGSINRSIETLCELLFDPFVLMMLRNVTGENQDEVSFVRHIRAKVLAYRENEIANIRKSIQDDWSVCEFLDEYVFDSKENHIREISMANGDWESKYESILADLKKIYSLKLYKHLTNQYVSSLEMKPQHWRHESDSIFNVLISIKSEEKEIKSLKREISDKVGTSDGQSESLGAQLDNAHSDYLIRMRSLTQRLFSKMVSIRVGQENIENIKKFNEFILKYSVPAIGVGIDPTVILDRFPDLCDSGQALNYIIQVFAENLIETLDTDDIKNKIKTKTQQNAKLLLNLAIKSSDNSAKQTDPSVEIQNLFNEFISSCHPYFVAQSPTPDIERAKKVFIVLWTNIQNLPELASTDMSICFNIAWINYSASRNSQYTNIGFTKH